MPPTVRPARQLLFWPITITLIIHGISKAALWMEGRRALEGRVGLP